MSTLDFFATGDSWIDKAGLDGTDLVTDKGGKQVGVRVTGSTDNMQELNEVARLSAYQHRYHKVEFAPNGDSQLAEFGKEVPVTELSEANTISSTLVNEKGIATGYHTVALDIDMPVRVVPSSKPGHYHLYIDHAMPWDDYVKVLDVLSEVGIVQKGYRDASVARGHSTLRLPWVKKPEVDA